jgi:hypothetical protein
MQRQRNQAGGGVENPIDLEEVHNHRWVALDGHTSALSISASTNNLAVTAHFNNVNKP